MTIKIVLATTMFLAGVASAWGESKFVSHAPMRPLPEASKRPLAKGPTYFIDAGKGDD